MSLADDLKKQTNDFRTKKIDYQVDTIAGYGNHSGGFFSPITNTITMNYHDDDVFMWLFEKNSHDCILYHEQKHRSNANKGFKSKNISVSSEQYYKLCMADEISAKMAELVYLREEYIKTGDVNVFDRSHGFSFYKEAVQQGEVNPLSSDPKDFEKDMSLIMNGTQKMWMDRWADRYFKNHIDMTENYLRYGKGNFKDNEAEYQKQLNIAYTIGGVNFKQYMKEDVKVPDDWRINDVDIIVKHMEKLEAFPFKDNMSFEQYNNLLQHLYIADGMKKQADFALSYYKAKKIEDLDDGQRKRYFNDLKEVMELQKDKLSERDWRVEKPINLQLNKALGNPGERVLLPNENEKNYQAALKQIYNINGVDYYSLLKINPQEKMPIEKTEEVKEFEEKSLSKRCVDKMANLLKNQKEKTPEPKEPKDYLNNYPKWSKNERVSEIQYEEILDLDKPVITGIPGAQRSQSTSSKNTNTETAAPSPAQNDSVAETPAPATQNAAAEKTNMDKAAYLRSLSGRPQQDTIARISPSFSQMRDNKNSMELMLLRRQNGR